MKLEPSPENPWQTHSTEIVYENPWLRVSESQVTHPGGGPGIYGVVHFKNRAIGVIPIDENDQTILVGQYRYATSTYEWEIPEGGCPADEKPEDAALRELQEETGWMAEKLEPLVDGVALSNSVCDERCTVYIATEISKTEASPEDCEELATREVAVDEAISMAMDGQIKDAVSVIALLKLGLIRSRNSAHESALI